MTASPIVPAPTFVPSPVVVDHVRQETADTSTVTVRAADGRRLPSFRPGQFSMLYVFGVGEAPISISGDAEHPDRLEYTIRAVGAVTRQLAGSRRGDQFGLRGPFGREWPLEEAVGRDLLLVAGGIGLAPLRSVVYHVLAHRDNYGRTALLYGARTANDRLYVDELERWSHAGVHVLQTVDQADLDWAGPVGVVTRLLPRIEADPARAVVMTCGPEVMMRATARALVGLGFRDDALYLSMERNMTCAIGVCGRCQFGPAFICTDGPVLPYARLRPWLGIREL